MTVLRSLRVNGTDLASLSGMIINRLDLWAPGTLRGSPEPIGGARGQISSDLPYDAYAFSVGVTIEGSDEAHYIANLRAIGAAIAPVGGLVTLERRLPNVGGTYDAYTAAGQFFGGLSATLLNSQTGQTELQFMNLDGAWTADGGTTWTVP